VECQVLFVGSSSDRLVAHIDDEISTEGSAAADLRNEPPEFPRAVGPIRYAPVL
jgi:hypothetical protein